jgi:hypothetical protein
MGKYSMIASQAGLHPHEARLTSRRQHHHRRHDMHARTLLHALAHHVPLHSDTRPCIPILAHAAAGWAHRCMRQHSCGRAVAAPEMNGPNQPAARCTCCLRHRSVVTVLHALCCAPWCSTDAAEDNRRATLQHDAAYCSTLHRVAAAVTRAETLVHRRPQPTPLRKWPRRRTTARSVSRTHTRCRRQPRSHIAARAKWGRCAAQFRRRCGRVSPVFVQMWPGVTGPRSYGLLVHTIGLSQGCAPCPEGQRCHVSPRLVRVGMPR